MGASSGLNVAAAVKVSGNAYGIISAKRDLQCNVCFFQDFKFFDILEV